MNTPLYDTSKTFFENAKEGPFGDYADGKIYEDSGEPTYDFFGKKIFAPFGIGAGPLPHSRFIKSAFDKGYDIATFKSVRTSFLKSNEDPVLFPVEDKGVDIIVDPVDSLTIASEYSDPLTVANSFGIPSFDPDEWKPALVEALEYSRSQKGKVMVTAFQGTDRGQGLETFAQDHVLGMNILKEIQPDVIEINLSCPNEGAQQLLCYTIDDAKYIVAKARKAIDDIPLILKIGYFTDRKLLQDFMREVGQYADGISAINTVPIPLVDKDGNQAFSGGPARSKGAISGRAIKKIAIQNVEYLADIRSKLRRNFQIIGVGGVLTPQDFLDHRNAGADFVMSVTGAMWNPYLAQEIKRKIRRSFK